MPPCTACRCTAVTTPIVETRVSVCTSERGQLLPEFVSEWSQVVPSGPSGSSIREEANDAFLGESAHHRFVTSPL